MKQTILIDVTITYSLTRTAVSDTISFSPIQIHIKNKPTVAYILLIGFPTGYDFQLMGCGSNVSLINITR